MLLSPKEINSHSKTTNSSKIKAKGSKTKSKSKVAKNSKKINKSNKMKHRQKITIKRSKKNKTISYPTPKSSSQNINKKIQKLRQALPK